MNVFYGLLPLISLGLCIAFFRGFADSIKKRPLVFYIIAILITAVSIFLAFTVKVERGQSVPWYLSVMNLLFGRGVVGTSIFIIVMFLGALPNKNALRKKLMPIRGYMSIMAGFFVLIHNLFLGQKYFILLFTNPSSMSTVKLLATIVSLIAILIFLPLFISSFKCVRKKMKAATWKKLQRKAYIYYYLIFTHIMILYIGKIPQIMHKQPERLSHYILGASFYIIVYVSYTIMKFKKDRFGFKKKK